jgi:hypothetical protein
VEADGLGLITSASARPNGTVHGANSGKSILVSARHDLGHRLCINAAKSTSSIYHCSFEILCPNGST